MSWSCQKCRQPLLLAPSISTELDLNQSAYDLVQDSFIAPSKLKAAKSPLPLLTTTPSTSTDPASSSASTAWKAHLPIQGSSSGADSGTADQNSLSARLAASSALFDLLSHPPFPQPDADSTRKGKAPIIDHPLCKPCTVTLLDIMDSQMKQLRSQRDSYLAFEAELVRYNILPRDKSHTDAAKEDLLRLQQAECDELVREIEQLHIDEKNAKEELSDAERKRLAVEEELLAIAEEEKTLELEEERFWAQYSAHSLTLNKLQEQEASLSMAVQHDSALLARLQHANVYNDAFCIGHDGGIATINGLRLGRLPSIGANVEWNEINAAWGQTALMLDVIARKMSIAFTGYKLIPKGSFSAVCRYDDPKYSASGQTSTAASEVSGSGSEGEQKTVYELYSSSDWQITRVLWSRRFDHAQVAFLSCLRQAVDYATAQDPALRLPHTINKDKIGEASIRLQFGSDEHWTRALRHVLLTLKILLSWTVSRTKHSESVAH